MTNNPPQNLQAERAVVGACILSVDALGNVSEILKPEDFYDTSNKMAYEICLNMYLENKPIDLVTFQNEAINRGVFERIGGQPFLAEIVSDVMTTGNAVYYAEIVQGIALRRRFVEAGYKITAIGLKPEMETGEIVSEVEKIILEASSRKEFSGPVPIQKAAYSTLAKIMELRSGARKNTGFMTGFVDLDRIISGFQPGSLNIIAARPSMGKTALALNIAQFGYKDNANGDVLFFSLEMPTEQLMHRMFSAQTLSFSTNGVPVSAIATGTLSDDEVYLVERAVQVLDHRNISINYSSELSAMDFRTQCRRFKMRHPDLSLIVVDYLQLMSSGSKRSDNRQYEVAEISRVMKSVAVELECPVIALSQLSRETEKRTDKKPQLADLRDSGAIEQDADTVIMLYREDYYSENENNNLMDSKADLRVAKNRNGSTGVCHLTFRREYTRFMNYAG
jgi:replicative DNA helicase